MYVIRRKDKYEYFYGFDNQYHPPKLLTSKFRKRLTYYKTLEETLPVMERIGNDWEVVQLRPVKTGIEIVRCANCRYYGKLVRIHRENGYKYVCNQHGIYMYEDGFCSDGKRREKDDGE